MDENTRSRRDPGDLNPENDAERSGHSIEDIRARRTARVETDMKPQSEESRESVRTQRDGSPTRTTSEPEPRDNTRETGNRTTLPGNTSETGVGSPEADTTPGQPGRTTSLPPSIGCGRPAAMMLMLATGCGVILARLVKR